MSNFVLLILLVVIPITISIFPIHKKIFLVLDYIVEQLGFRQNRKEENKDAKAEMQFDKNFFDPSQGIIDRVGFFNQFEQPIIVPQGTDIWKQFLRENQYENNVPYNFVCSSDMNPIGGIISNFLIKQFELPTFTRQLATNSRRYGYSTVFGTQLAKAGWDTGMDTKAPIFWSYYCLTLTEKTYTKWGVFSVGKNSILVDRNAIKRGDLRALSDLLELFWSEPCLIKENGLTRLSSWEEAKTTWLNTRKEKRG